MKLLFDENLSPKLPDLIQNQFPGSTHVRDCGLKGATDPVIWQYAGAQGFTVVSKDGDFYPRAMLLGPPPKLIWLGLGNCTRTEVLELLLKYESDIRALECAAESVLILS
jgi:predicted nuclease of predicted toxin-antitoxin system